MPSLSLSKSKASATPSPSISQRVCLTSISSIARSFPDPPGALLTNCTINAVSDVVNCCVNCFHSDTIQLLKEGSDGLYAGSFGSLIAPGHLVMSPVSNVAKSVLLSREKKFTVTLGSILGSSPAENRVSSLSMFTTQKL